MPEAGQPMLDGRQQPDARSLARWMGAENYRRWKHLLHLIETEYPGVFVPDWQFGGQKHGWSLRFKKSKSFCTLIPRRDQLAILIVFGGEERRQAEAILSELASHVRADYESATTFHDGKWVWSSVDDDDALRDVKRLLTIKRRPRRPATTSAGR